MPIHLLAGADDVSIDDALGDLVAGARLPVGLAEANLTRFDANTFTFDAFRFACEALPFLADGRVVTCRGVLAALSGRHERSAARTASAGSGAARATAPARRARKADTASSADAPAVKEPDEASGSGRDARGPRPADAPAVKEPDEALAAYLPLVPSWALVIFVESELPAPTSPLGRAFAAREIFVRPFPVPEGDAMVRWLRERARRAAGADAPSRGAMTVDAAQALAAHVGTDVRLAAAEVRKLVAYAGPGRAVEARDVELLTPHASTSAKVWELTQAILEGQRERATVRMGQLIDGADYRPEQVIASVRSAVAQHLNVLAMVHAGDDDPTIGRRLRMQPFAVKMTRERAARLGDRALAYMHRQVLEADLSLKTGRASPRLAAELLVIELAARAVQAMHMARERGTYR